MKKILAELIYSICIMIITIIVCIFTSFEFNDRIVYGIAILFMFYILPIGILFIGLLRETRNNNYYICSETINAIIFLLIGGTFLVLHGFVFFDEKAYSKYRLLQIFVSVLIYAIIIIYLVLSYRKRNSNKKNISNNN